MSTGSNIQLYTWFGSLNAVQAFQHSTLKIFFPSLLPTACTKHKPLFFLPCVMSSSKQNSSNTSPKIGKAGSSPSLVSSFSVCLFPRYQTLSMSALFLEDGIAYPFTGAVALPCCWEIVLYGSVMPLHVLFSMPTMQGPDRLYYLLLNNRFLQSRNLKQQTFIF